MIAFTAIAVGYLLGSIPFASMIARRRGVDLRRSGSGNLGAANVYRTMGAAVGGTVLALDVGKGALAVVMSQQLGPDPIAPTAAAVAAVVGHVYPVWLRFRGGKGVATAFGAF